VPVTVATSSDGLTVTGSADGRPVSPSWSRTRHGGRTFTLHRAARPSGTGVRAAPRPAESDALRLGLRLHGHGTATATSTPFNAGTVQVDVRDGGPTAAYSGLVVASETAHGRGTRRASSPSPAVPTAPG
jgi:hypothetical protein